jgi:hypothetical protein
MMPPDSLPFLHHQRHHEMARQADHARLARATRRKPGSEERAFQPLLGWVGATLLSRGCTAPRAGRATKAGEKGCCVCL